MTSYHPWTVGYLEEMFANPDPWKYLTSPYERTKYQRQINIIADRMPAPGRILEIGSAEGAHTFMIAKHFPSAQITCVEISANALSRARERLKPYKDRVEFVNADILKYEPQMEESSCDVCVWSESVYYVGASISLNRTYCLLKEIVGKLRPGGLLVMANTVDLPEDIPESIITSRPLIDCYYYFLSSLAEPTLKSVYVEEKHGRLYEYQIWAFRRQ